jgi:hypothetical protein
VKGIYDFFAKVLLGVASLVLLGSSVRGQSTEVTVRVAREGRLANITLTTPVSVAKGSFSFDVVSKSTMQDIETQVVTNPAARMQYVAPTRTLTEDAVELGENQAQNLHRASYRIPRGQLLDQVNFIFTDQYSQFKVSWKVSHTKLTPSKAVVNFGVDQDGDGFPELLEVRRPSSGIVVLADYDANPDARPDQLEPQIWRDRGDGSCDWNCDGIESLEHTKVEGYLTSATDWREGWRGRSTPPPVGLVDIYVMTLPCCPDSPGFGIVVQRGI